MREKTTVLKVALALICALLFVPASKADQDPTGCVSAEPLISFPEETITTATGPVRQGDELKLGIRIASPSFNSCYISDIMVWLQEPNPDGTPGTLRKLGGTYGIGSGFAMTDPSAITHVVNLNPEVFEAPLGLRWEATIHDGEQDRVVTGQGTGTTIKVTRPTAELQIIPNVFQGPAPLTVEYTYRLTNTSITSAGTKAPSIVPTGPSGPNDVLFDKSCGNLTFKSGDEGSSDRPLLSPGETWAFSCTRTFDVPGKFANSPVITGNSDVDGRPWPQVPTSPEVTSLGPDLTVTKTHTGDFLAGSTGQYTITATNNGNQETSGTVIVRDELPSGMTAKSITGDGWTCDLSSSSCTRTDPLPSGSTYPPIALTVSLHQTPPTSVVNVATVAGGGEVEGVASNNSVSDQTKIRRPSQPDAATGRTFKVRQATSLTNGKVRLKVMIPGPGRLWADDAGKPDLIRREARKIKKSGTANLVLKPTAQLRQAIKRSGKPRKVKLRVVFKARHDASVAGKLWTTHSVFFSPPRTKG